MGSNDSRTLGGDPISLLDVGFLLAPRLRLHGLNRARSTIRFHVSNSSHRSWLYDRTLLPTHWQVWTGISAPKKDVYFYNCDCSNRAFLGPKCQCLRGDYLVYGNSTKNYWSEALDCDCSNICLLLNTKHLLSRTDRQEAKAKDWDWGNRKKV